MTVADVLHKTRFTAHREFITNVEPLNGYAFSIGRARLLAGRMTTGGIKASSAGETIRPARSRALPIHTSVVTGEPRISSLHLWPLHQHIRGLFLVNRSITELDLSKSMSTVETTGVLILLKCIQPDRCAELVLGIREQQGP